jgi:hypothetical protein
VESSETKLSELFVFLELTDEMPDREYYKNRSLAANFDIEQIKKIRPRYTKTLGDVEKTVYNNRVNAWTNELSEKDLKICEVICGSLGEYAGYKKTMKIPFSEKIFIRITTFPQYIKSAIDYYKEYLIYYVSPSLKLWRIKNKKFAVPKSNN